MAADKHVLIHVFDEFRKAAKDFVCPRGLLLEKMRYFRAYLNQSNEHDEIDISVHCDVEIFEWLVEYMHSPEGGTRSPIALDNIASILVSSEFLQMDALVEECIAFVSNCMQEFLRLRVDISCLSDTTIAKIAERCSAETLQRLNDPKDKILSKLQRKKLEGLLRDIQSSDRMLCCCDNCGILFVNTDSARLHCSLGTPRLAAHGDLIAEHRAKTGWVPEEWIKTLIQSKTVSWGALYWTVWASTRCIRCVVCQEYSSLLQFDKCEFHPGQITGVGADAKFSCCGGRIFGGDTDHNGCQMRQHTLAATAPSHEKANAALLANCWDLVAECRAAAHHAFASTETSSERPRCSGMAIVFPLPPLESAPGDLDQAALKKPFRAADDAATSPRRRRMWQALRRQEMDHARMELLTKRLIQLRKNLTT